MSTKITYGLYLALVGIVIQLIGYLLGLESGKQGAGIAVMGDLLWLVSVAIFVIVLWLGVRAVREEQETEAFTFGQAFGAGITMVLVSAVIGAIYTFVHYSFVNPAMIDRFAEMVPMMRQKWEQSGMTEEKIEMAEKVVGMIYSPVGLAVMGLVMKIAAGAVVALIIAAIAKRKAPLAPAVPPAL